MQWNLEQVRSFVIAADAGSFSAAARRLGRAQSVISTHISLLEAELGLELFDRQKRCPVLTETGTAMLAESRELLRQCGQMESRALGLCKQPDASMRLALDEGLPYSTMMELLADLAVAFPYLEVRAMYGSTAEVRRWVNSGGVHFAVAFDESTPALDPEVIPFWIGSVEQVLVAARDHPLCALPRITRNELAKHREILIRFSLDDQTQPLQPTAPRPGYTGISPLLWETNSSFAAADLALRGIGWTIVPVTLAHSESFPNGLVILDPGEVSFPALDILLLSKSGRKTSAAADWFQNKLKKALLPRGV